MIDYLLKEEDLNKNQIDKHYFGYKEDLDWFINVIKNIETN